MSSTPATRKRKRERTTNASDDNDDEEQDEIATSASTAASTASAAAATSTREGKEAKTREVKRQPSLPATPPSVGAASSAAPPAAASASASSSVSRSQPTRSPAIDYSEYVFSEDDDDDHGQYARGDYQARGHRQQRSGSGGAGTGLPSLRSVPATPERRSTRNHQQQGFASAGSGVGSRSQRRQTRQDTLASPLRGPEGKDAAAASASARTTGDHSGEDDTEEDSDELASSAVGFHQRRSSRKRRRLDADGLASGSGSGSGESKRAGSAGNLGGAGAGASSTGASSSSGGMGLTGFSLAAPARTTTTSHALMMAELARQDETPAQPTMVRDLLSYIQCQVCQTPITSPILQCLSGHLLCTDCVHQLRRSASASAGGPSGGVCPTCRCHLPSSAQEFPRVLALENLVRESTTLPCPFRFFGCKQDQLQYNKCREHVRECEFAQVPCLASEMYSSACSWRGPYADLASHMQNGCEDAACKPMTYFLTNSLAFLHLPFDKVRTSASAPGKAWVPPAPTLVHAHNRDFLIMTTTSTITATGRTSYSSWSSYQNQSGVYLVVVLVGTPADARKFSCTLAVSVDNPQNPTQRPEILSSTHCPIAYGDFLKKAGDKKLHECWRLMVPLSLFEIYSSSSGASAGAGSSSSSSSVSPIKKVLPHTPRCLYVRIAAIDPTAPVEYVPGDLVVARPAAAPSDDA